VKERAGAAGLAVGNGGGEHKSEGALDQRHGHRADAGEHDDASEPARTAS